ncbi:DUF1289 domain-containing protein [Serratia rubidaea]|uniref:DUF1289 domain-containing protein n=1 Tax=Serratia rubidaea TaxID=61652 RepID=UPI003FA368D1
MPQQLEFFDIPSPCRGICQADERGYCRGCLRSREERFGWMNMSDAQKREVLRLCRQRLLRLCRQRLLRLQRANKAAEEHDPDQPSLF